MKSKKHVGMIGTIIISLLVGGVSGAGTSMYLLASDIVDFQEEVTTTVSEVYTEESKLISAYDKVSPAVVSIVALQDLNAYLDQYFWGPLEQYYSYDTGGERNLQEVGGGTAFIVSKDGMAVTNRHVIEDTSLEYVAYTVDGVKFDVEILDVDSTNDLAILQLTAQEESEEAALLGSLPYVEFGDSESLKVGQMVLAIGNAFAEYENTTTAGIVSATGREIIASNMQGMNPSALDGLVQTDAAINPGNSGGPLVNLDGQVIGVNTAVDTQAEGIGFALPINDVVKIVDSYNLYGYIARPYLGIYYVMINEAADEKFGLGVSYGAALVGDSMSGKPAIVEGSPAYEAGLKARDIIIEFGGVVLSDEYNLSDAILDYNIGDEVVLKVWRDKKEIEVKVVLGQTE
ncbi:MAG: trypsin-like peptidase domain-containing protein [Patescibacteria group bacterium]|nr:trypsin-like peptidase domain-containing protein [Patescibacteria group bacterium]